MKRPDLTLIGAGNVATHLGKALVDAGSEVAQVYSRSEQPARQLAKNLDARYVGAMEQLNPTAIVLLAVSDDAIASVASTLPFRNALVLHTSGSVTMEALADNAQQYGVLYPLQTFSKDRPVDFNEVPLLIEANTQEALDTLETLAKAVSGNVRYVQSNDRLKYHLSAVIANNFTNHLLTEAKNYLDDQQLDFTVLHPLILETVAKAIELGPEDAQTGPARRNDQGTIRQHLDLLEGEELKALYEFLTGRIRKDN